MLLATEQNMFSYMWEFRGQFLKQLIDGGETSLARVLGLFQSFSRRYGLSVETASATLADGRTITILTGTGHWQRQQANPANHPPVLLPDGRPMLAFTRIAGAETICPSGNEYDRVGVNYLLDLIRKQPFDAIVELGSGLGERLFELYLEGGPPDIPYFGAEYWESGRRAADLLASLEPRLDFRSVAFDLSQPDFSFLAGFRRVLLFTNASAYCVPELPADIAARMAAAAPEVTGVHFELINHQVVVDPGAEAMKEIEERKQNSDFADHMMHAQSCGQIAMEYYAPNAYMVSSGQPATIMHWRSP